MPITGSSAFPGYRSGAACFAVAMFGLIASDDRPRAQDAPPPSAEQPPAASPAQPPAEAPATQGGGLIDKLGDWLRDSADGVSSGLKDINKGTLDTLTSIPVAGFATGRALCPRADNGVPDCYAATERLCKDKGYSFGRSLDTVSSETCNPRVFLPGYQRKPGDCRTDTFVTRAACQ